MLQGPALLPTLNDPVELRQFIAAMEKGLEFLREHERRIFPDQAPEPGRIRRNRSAPRHDPADTEWQYDRVLRVTKKLEENLKRSPTKREIFRYIRVVDFGDLTQLIDDLVRGRKLKEIIRKGHEYYHVLTLQEVRREEETNRSPMGHIQIKDQLVAVYDGVSGRLRNGGIYYIIDGNETLCYLRESEEGIAVQDWIEAGDRFCPMSCDD